MTPVVSFSPDAGFAKGSKDFATLTRHNISKTKKSVALFAKIGVSGLLLFLIAHEVSLDLIETRLGSANPAPLIAASICIALQALGIVTWRWHTVLGIIGWTVRWPVLLRLVLIGVFFNQVLPTTFGGDGFRIWYLSKAEVPTGAAFRSVVLDRILGLFGLMLLALAAGLTLSVNFGESAIVSGILTLSLAGIISVMFGPVILSALGAVPLPFLQKIVRTLHQEILALWKDRPRLGLMILVSVAGHVLTCLAVWLAARGFDIQFPLGLSIAVVPLVLLVTALPISIAGWGVREGSMVVGLGLLGVPDSDAALVSVVIGLIGVGLGALGGLTWLVSGNRRQKD